MMTIRAKTKKLWIDARTGPLDDYFYCGWCGRKFEFDEKERRDVHEAKCRKLSFTYVARPKDLP
jgi:hypothetical protein